jgi:hypothetical protein
VYCSGGTNVDVSETLDSLSLGAGACTQDGSNSCPNNPGNVCCSNRCEGVGVGSGNTAVHAIGTGAGNSGKGALVMTCDIRTKSGLPFGQDCSVVAYTGTPQPHELTTATTTAIMINHCAGNGAPAAVVPTLTPAVGENFSCTQWTNSAGPGTMAWILNTEEPSGLIGGDGANLLQGLLVLFKIWTKTIRILLQHCCRYSLYAIHMIAACLVN